MSDACTINVEYVTGVHTQWPFESDVLIPVRRVAMLCMKQRKG
jgi:hypothetical protein